MFDNLMKIFKKFGKKEDNTMNSSRDAAKERLHLVLMQDRANVSADFLELMKQEIIDVIKKYIDVDEKEIDVRLTNKENSDGTNGAPALYANIPILNIKNEARKKGKEDSQDTNDNMNLNDINNKDVSNDKVLNDNTKNKQNKENKENKIKNKKSKLEKDSKEKNKEKIKNKEKEKEKNNNESEISDFNKDINESANLLDNNTEDNIKSKD